MLQGAINHVSVTVSDLERAMDFFRPLLEFLGYTVSDVLENPAARSRLTVNVNDANGTAFNVWEARPESRDHPFEVYERGLHHVAFNVAAHAQVDELVELLKRIGARILDGPGEFPFADGGYYAVYFLGPDDLKFEVVHMPELETAYRAKGVL